MIVKILQILGNWIKKIQKTSNTVNTITEDIEEIKNYQTMINNIITEIRNTLEGTDCRKTEAEEEKAKHWRIDAFELWCWRRLMRVSWTARRSKQSILKEINCEYSLEGLMLKLKLQYFGYLIQRPWCWERLKAGGEGDDRGQVGWMASPTPWTWVWANSGSWW